MYSSKEDVEYWGGFSGSVGLTPYDYENTLLRAIDIGDRAIDEYCNRPDGFFEAGGAAIVNEYHNGIEVGYHGTYPSFMMFGVKRRPFLRLQQTPVLQVTKLEHQDSSGSWSTKTEGRSSDYLVLEDGIRYIANAPKYDYKNVRVTYLAGYTVTPGVIAEISARLAASLIHRIQDAMDRRTASTGGVTDQPPPNTQLGDAILTDDMKRRLSSFRCNVPVAVL